MVTYQYACDRDGLVDVRMPMGAAERSGRCPRCGGNARRVFAPPMTSRVDPRRVAAIDRTERSADTPDVVSGLPARGPRRRVPAAAVNPAVARLPRP